MTQIKIYNYQLQQLPEKWILGDFTGIPEDAIKFLITSYKKIYPQRVTEVTQDGKVTQMISKSGEIIWNSGDNFIGLGSSGLYLETIGDGPIIYVESEGGTPVNVTIESDIQEDTQSLQMINYEMNFLGTYKMINLDSTKWEIFRSLGETRNNWKKIGIVESDGNQEWSQIIKVLEKSAQMAQSLDVIQMWGPTILSRLNKIEGEIFKDVILDVHQILQQIKNPKEE